jgi:hypothetical protein
MSAVHAADDVRLFAGDGTDPGDRHLDGPNMGTPDESAQMGTNRS